MQYGCSVAKNVLLVMEYGHKSTASVMQNSNLRRLPGLTGPSCKYVF